MLDPRYSITLSNARALYSTPPTLYMYHSLPSISNFSVSETSPRHFLFFRMPYIVVTQSDRTGPLPNSQSHTKAPTGLQGSTGHHCHSR